MHHTAREWADLRRKSRSSDPWDRLAALAGALGSIERALDALDVERRPREGFMSRLRRSGHIPGPLPKSKRPRRPLTLQERLKRLMTHRWNLVSVERAADARHAAVHGKGVVGPRKCEEHFLTIYRLWRHLRSRFVTRQNAARLSADLLSSGLATEVFLFGSLLRRSQGARDIDFLLFGCQDLPFRRAADYSGEATLSTVLLLEAADIASAANVAAAEIGWLEIIFVFGDHFQHDRSYRAQIAQSQVDPLFFLNIADGLRRFDPASRRWTAEVPEVFSRLATLRRRLEKEGMVRARRKSNLPRAALAATDSP